MLLLRYRPHFWRLVVTSPRKLVETPRTYVRFSLSLPEEDLCLVHEFSWRYLDRNAVGWQMICRKAVEGDWQILDHAGRLKFRSGLVTRAIVIGQHLPPGIRLLGERQWGELIVWGRAQWIRGTDCWSVLIIGSSMTNIARKCRSQYSCSGGSPVLELELYLLFPSIDTSPTSGSSSPALNTPLFFKYEFFLV